VKVLKIRGTADKVGMCQSAIYAAVAAGSFPPPVKLGQRAAGWIESELDQWLEQRRIERDARVAAKLAEKAAADADEVKARKRGRPSTRHLREREAA